ncbi:hypothetical protein EZI54_07380 [Marinobacter halodurans]|uniref:Uncharacterized protein n=1 Tax=Marinobacter halodurans TaxID=2528979 RepID=A0ABY1ZPH5_9GAMM|nr:hypothetical protein [Marinobacter halodurans]TBW57473.1 hypothetical protein EZI54_07380 [Marinobacter halodurans]
MAEHHIVLQPIDGSIIQRLYARLEEQFASGEGIRGSIKGVDLAMLMNVPPTRLSSLKKAQPGGLPEDEQDSTRRTIKPSQAVLTRLLLRYPHYAPLIPMPDAREVWRHVKPLISTEYFPESRREASQIMFAPLFGRSYPASYKLLSGDDESAGTASDPPSNVLRLFTLVMEKLAVVFRESLLQYLEEHAPASVTEQARRRMPRNWLALNEEEDLIRDLVPSAYQQTFRMQVHERKKGWFELYLQVLSDEAVSRNLIERDAITRGGWRNNDELAPESLFDFNIRQRPIVGGSEDIFQSLRNMGGVDLLNPDADVSDEPMTSAEFFWLIGLNAKAYYSMLSHKKRRIDPTSSILMRYLYRYPRDISTFISAPPLGRKVLERIREIDPSFRTSHLGPLFGGSYVSSYHFANSNHCPYDLRRLVGIFMDQVDSHPEIYQQIKQCAEEEAFARGVDRQTFWREARWYPKEAK